MLHECYLKDVQRYTMFYSMINMLLSISLFLIFSNSNLQVSATELATNLETDPIVRISDGSLRGSILYSVNGRPFYSFKGIPFAQPPVGPLRFKNPIPANKWSGIFNATQSSPWCAQIGAPYPTSSEDCLYLDVHSPNIDLSSHPLPVIVYIFAGGFIEGTFLFNGPQRLMDRDVIVVYMNYRLGALGFLGTGDKAAPGNFAFFDQALALEWVQENIRAFGGDPKRVMLTGHSAGSMSVSAHLVSPVSKGLFHSALIPSGTILLQYAFEYNPIQYAYKLADVLGCPKDNHEVMVNCFRQAPVESITAHSLDLRGDILLEVPFPPCVDGVFLPDDPYELFASGKINKVPTVFGSSINEGTFLYESTGSAARFLSITTMNSLDAPLEMFLNYLRYTINTNEVATAVAEAYYGSLDLTNNTAVQKATIDFFSDIALTVKTYWCALFLTYLNVGLPTYFYSFEYAGTSSTIIFNGQKLINHGDHEYYIFFIGNGYLSPQDQIVSEKLIDMWYNLAKNGNPGDYFKPTTMKIDFDYLKIATNGTFAMTDSYRTTFVNLWIIDVPLIVYRSFLIGMNLFRQFSWWIY